MAAESWSPSHSLGVKHQSPTACKPSALLALYLLLFSPPLGRHLSSFTQSHYDPPSDLCVTRCFCWGSQRTKGVEIHSADKWSKGSKLKTLAVGVNEQVHPFGADFRCTVPLISVWELSSRMTPSYLPHTVHVGVLVYSESESSPSVSLFPFNVSQVSPNSGRVATVARHHPSFDIQLKISKKWEQNHSSFITANTFGMWWYFCSNWCVCKATEVSAFWWQIGKRGGIDLSTLCSDKKTSGG